jgi:hypothetical protein
MITNCIIPEPTQLVKNHSKQSTLWVTMLEFSNHRRSPEDGIPCIASRGCSAPCCLEEQVPEGRLCGPSELMSAIHTVMKIMALLNQAVPIEFRSPYYFTVNIHQEMTCHGSQSYGMVYTAQMAEYMFFLCSGFLYMLQTCPIFVSTNSTTKKYTNTQIPWIRFNCL